MATETTPYPVRLNIDYPDRQLNRLTSFFRAFTLIPIWILLVFIAGGNFSSWRTNETFHFSAYASTAGWGIIAAVALLILFRQKYPRFIFDWSLALYRFSSRVYAYVLLMRDEYPSVDEEQSVHLEVDYPNAKELNRWLPLVKWLLAFPHYIVLLALILIAIILVVIAWFAILFTGKYPKGIFTFVEGTMRWGMRVCGYAFLLVTDKYPPFSLD